MTHLARVVFATSLVAAAIGLAGTPDAEAGANAAVCALGYGKADGLNCDYATYDQCRAAISGTPASCMDNPHLRAAQNQITRPREQRR